MFKILTLNESVETEKGTNKVVITHKFFNSLPNCFHYRIHKHEWINFTCSGADAETVCTGM